MTHEKGGFGWETDYARQMVSDGLWMRQSGADGIREGDHARRRLYVWWKRNRLDENTDEDSCVV